LREEEGGEREGKERRIYSIGECHAILLVVNSNNIIPGVHIARCWRVKKLEVENNNVPVLAFEDPRRKLINNITIF
jgi:hypothetical protein